MQCVVITQIGLTLEPLATSNQPNAKAVLSNAN